MSCLSSLLIFSPNFAQMKVKGPRINQSSDTVPISDTKPCPLSPVPFLTSPQSPAVDYSPLRSLLPWSHIPPLSLLKKKLSD